MEEIFSEYYLFYQY